MYKFIKNVNADKYQSLLKGAKWKQVKSNDRNFYTCMVDFPGCTIAFLLKIPPGGKVHRHKDTPRPEKTYHLPLISNKYCTNYTYNPNSKQHLEVGKLYEIDRQIDHDSWNLGETDRIHLILECNDLPL